MRREKGGNREIEPENAGAAFHRGLIAVATETTATSAKRPQRPQNDRKTTEKNGAVVGSRPKHVSYNGGQVISAGRRCGMGEAATFENGIYRQGPARLSDLCGEKGLAIGNSNFEAVVRTSVFVDKSMLIADI